MSEEKYSKNPLVLAYAEVRYNVGYRLSNFMQNKNLTEGVWEKLFYWAYASESAYNCLIIPELGKRVRKQQREEKRARRIYNKRMKQRSRNV